MEKNQSGSAKILGILSTVFGGISIIPLLNFIFVWPAVVLGLIGLILAAVGNVKSKGASIALNIVGLALGVLSLVIYIF